MKHLPLNCLLVLLHALVSLNVSAAKAYPGTGVVADRPPSEIQIPYRYVTCQPPASEQVLEWVALTFRHTDAVETERGLAVPFTFSVGRRMGLIQGTILVNFLADGYEYQVVKVRRLDNDESDQLGELQPYVEDDLHAIREWFEQYFRLVPPR